MSRKLSSYLCAVNSLVLSLRTSVVPGVFVRKVLGFWAVKMTDAFTPALDKQSVKHTVGLDKCARYFRSR